ncbi:MAG: S41 family peptidase [Mangrovibacterium sp.]
MYTNKKLYLLGAMLLLLTSCFDNDISEIGGTPTENFNLLWQQVNDNYCYLEYKEINWDSIGEVYQAKVSDDMSDEALFTVCADMLNELKDGHVNLVSGFDVSRYWDWYLDYPQNFNRTILERNYLGADFKILGGLYAQKINNVGYLYYRSFMNEFSTDLLQTALSQFGDIVGLIIDVRDNGGGSLYYSQLFASAFAPEEMIYGYIRYKEGVGDSYSSYFPQYLEPEGAALYEGNIVVLANRSSYSATNNFVSAMSCLENVTIIGDKTGGGGGAPFSSELYNGWQVRFSRNPLYDKDKKHIEFGIEPDISVDMTNDGKDRIIDEAIDYLKKLLEK